MTAIPQQPDDALAILKRLEPVLTSIAADVVLLRTDVAGLKTDVAGLKTDVVALKVEVANLQGRVSQLPTTLQLLTAIVATVFGTAGILFAALNYAKTL